MQDFQEKKLDSCRTTYNVPIGIIVAYRLLSKSQSDTRRLYIARVTS